LRNNLYGDEARQALLKGAEMLSRVVGASMGPEGRNTVFDPALLHPTYPTSSRDGVTIARQFFVEGPEATGIKMVKEAAERTVQEAGDGTSATVVLAAAMLRSGMEELKKGNLRAIRQRLLEDTRKSCEYLDKITMRLSGSMLRQVAIISANNDTALGNCIADATLSAGIHGVVAVEESLSGETTIDRIEGMSLNSGYISQAFVNNEQRQICELLNPLIILLDRPLTSMQGMAPLMNDIANGGRPVLILAEDVRGEALATLALNKLQGRLSVCAVRLPSNLGHRKDLLLDIAALTGGCAVLQEIGMDITGLKLNQLGSAQKAVITSNSCRIIGGRGKKEELAKRVDHIKGMLDQNPTPLEREKLNERLAKLTGGLTVIRLGARSGLEMGDLKARCEDSCLATRCAMDEGIVIGGGLALAKCAWHLRFTDKGPSPLSRAMLIPAQRILQNAGFDGTLNSQGNVGRNAMTGAEEDFFYAGIIDPVKVVKASLRNAVSVVQVMLATECLIQVNHEQ
jgi:chaperonin GroEL